MQKNLKIKNHNENNERKHHQTSLKPGSQNITQLIENKPSVVKPKDPNQDLNISKYEY